MKEPLFEKNSVEMLTIMELVALIQGTNSNKLWLPPIQRSVVWDNNQIINYWDSLLRGYPPGMMMVYGVQKNKANLPVSGVDAMDGKTCQAKEGDFHLFDGQQRLTAVLLGLNNGQLKDTRKLWVDFGMKPKKESGLKFQLRMNSTGQPFGYSPDTPNQKIELKQRQKQWDELRKTYGSNITPQSLFKDDLAGRYLIGAKSVVSFVHVYDLLFRSGKKETIETLTKQADADGEIVKEFVCALENALYGKLILQEVPENIITDQDEYIRFFGRLGQGGTRLSDDELTYSIVKHQFPEIRDQMQAIMKSEAGRLAGEVDLVLASLRVAKTLEPWKDAKEWEIIGRPTPAFVSRLSDIEGARKKFCELIFPHNPQCAFRDMPISLETILIEIRKVLSYEKNAHQSGLPAILLSRLPRELVDVLILITLKHKQILAGGSVEWPDDERSTLRAFVLHWLLFVANDSKAAWSVFHLAMINNGDPKWSFTRESICSLVSQYEKDGIARVVPRNDAIKHLQNEVKELGHLLRSWSDRFTSVDRGGDRKPGESLRVLSTNRELYQRALMWLQRDYIATNFPYYDPTSDRDDDLPIDLDHLIPSSLFGFHWSTNSKCLHDDFSQEELDNFHWHRSTIGNSLGNFRWLDAGKNRERKNEELDPSDNYRDLFLDPEEWNQLIRNQKKGSGWSKKDIAAFQRMIDLRTTRLYEELLTTSGIEDILPPIQS